MMTAEERAGLLMRAAAALAEAIDAVRGLARDLDGGGLEAYEAEESACMVIELQGEDVWTALRTVAMRLDRAALAKWGGA